MHDDGSLPTATTCSTHFLIANGGVTGSLTKGGKAHLDDPKIKEAVVKSLTYITTAYKGDYVPSGALSWNDA